MKVSSLVCFVVSHVLYYFIDQHLMARIHSRGLLGTQEKTSFQATAETFTCQYDEAESHVLAFPEIFVGLSMSLLAKRINLH